MKEKIAVILGSKSDYKQLNEAFAILDELKIGYQMDVISAHRNPEKLRILCKKMEVEGVEVVIACAGLAAALPGFIASYVNIPVIGVAMKGGLMDGLDALFSIVSSPKGLGLASTGVGKSAFLNAAIFALEIISLKNKKYLPQLKSLKAKFK